jgi:hypothetical protein
VILHESGFQLVGRYVFACAHEWTPGQVVGFLYSTSVLSRAVLGELATDFEADVRNELRIFERDGRLRHTGEFAFDLAKRPA